MTRRRRNLERLNFSLPPFCKPKACLVSPPRWFRARAPTHTPFIPSSHSQPLLRRKLQLLYKLRTRLLPMYEVAETSPHTALSTIQPATRLAEVRNGGQLAVDGARRVPTRIQRIAGALRTVLVFETRVHVTDQVVIVVVAHDHLLDLAKLAHLAPKVFVESVEVVLQLRAGHLVLRVVGGVLVEVGQQDGL